MSEIVKGDGFIAHVVYGHSEIKTFFKRDGNYYVSYGYRIDYDESGNESGRTEPKPIGILRNCGSLPEWVDVR